MHRCLNHHARTDLTACLDGSISLGLTYKPKPYINAQVMTQIMHAYRINYLDRNINSHRFFIFPIKEYVLKFLSNLFERFI